MVPQRLWLFGEIDNIHNTVGLVLAVCDPGVSNLLALFEVRPPPQGVGIRWG